MLLLRQQVGAFLVVGIYFDLKQLRPELPGDE
jgi:hypothetical protein